MKYTAANTVGIGKPKICFVDGVEISNVIECDTNEGYAIYHPVDEDGNFRIRGGYPITETIHGVVTVEDAN